MAQEEKKRRSAFPKPTPEELISQAQDQPENQELLDGVSSRPARRFKENTHDPAVGHLINDARFANKTPGERKKILSDLDRIKITLDTNAHLSAAINQIVDQHDASSSGVISLFLLIGLEEYLKGNVDLDSFKTPSRTPRFSWLIDYENALRDVLSNHEIDPLYKGKLEKFERELKKFLEN